MEKMNNEKIKDLLGEIADNFQENGVDQRTAKFYAKNIGNLYGLLLSHDYTKSNLHLGFDQNYNMIETRHEQSVITVNRQPKDSEEANQVLFRMVEIGEKMQADQEKLV